MARYRLTSFLLVGCLLVGGAIWAFDLTGPAPLPTPSPTTLVLNVPTDRVMRVTYRTGGAAYTAERVEGGWELRDAVSGFGDRRRIDDSVARVSRLTSTRTLTAGDPSQFGLSPPVGVLELGMNDGVVTKLEIGDRSSDGGSVYVRPYGGDTIHVVAAFALNDLMQWRQDPPVPRPTATAVRTATPRPTMTPAA